MCVFQRVHGRMRAKECSPACRAALIVALVFASDRLEAQKKNPLIRSTCRLSELRRKSQDLYRMRVDKGGKEGEGIK